jgi:8-oxo-dGTP pyrophosphatase MutT (NUDIX family)
MTVLSRSMFLQRTRARIRAVLISLAVSMNKESANKTSAGAKMPTLNQVSAGGVAFRLNESLTEVAIISVAPGGRWQLPKGIIDEGESPEAAAVREVREEAGIGTALLAPLDTVEYWYVGTESGGQRVRYHKHVHFFLLAYRGGDVANHDHEVMEARWVGIDEAIEMLAFKSERVVVEKAREMIASLQKPG